MKYSKPLSILLTSLAVLGLSFTTDAVAGSDRYQARILRDARSCIDQIDKRIDLESASRIVHLVEETRQRNLAEVQIRIETRVYESSSEFSKAKYDSFCTAAGLGKIVEFRITKI